MKMGCHVRSVFYFIHSNYKTYQCLLNVESYVTTSVRSVIIVLQQSIPELFSSNNVPVFMKILNKVKATTD